MRNWKFLKYDIHGYMIGSSQNSPKKQGINKWNLKYAIDCNPYNYDS